MVEEVTQDHVPVVPVFSITNDPKKNKVNFDDIAGRQENGRGGDPGPCAGGARLLNN